MLILTAVSWVGACVVQDRVRPSSLTNTEKKAAVKCSAMSVCCGRAVKLFDDDDDDDATMLISVELI